jgi:NhaA family Na+:H+ antiporter
MREQLQKNIETRLFIPALQFLHREKSSGIVLGVFVVLALVLANSPLSEGVHAFPGTSFRICHQWPALPQLQHRPLGERRPDVDVLLCGRPRTKREFIGGELRDIRKVTLPVMAAVFGMVFPALFYLLFNAGTAEAVGWGIPMATDIAFALAVVYLLGDRVPVSAKVFLTTLAIVDDLGSVIVIACSIPHRSTC